MLNTYSGSMNGLDSVMGGSWSGLEAFGGQTFGKLEKWVYVALGRISEHNNMTSLIAHFFRFQGFTIDE